MLTPSRDYKFNPLILDEIQTGADNLDPAEICGVAVIGFIKGYIARVYGERKRNFVGQIFLARGFFVSTVGRDEAVIREYIKNQEAEDNRLEQLSLWR